MKIHVFLLVLIIPIVVNCKSDKKSNNGASQISNYEYLEDGIKITAINHATMVLEFEDIVIYNDPVGGKEAFTNQKAPTMVLISDIHGDHLNVETLQALDLTKATVIVPQAVADILPDINAKEVMIINNGETKEVDAVDVEAIPMYNLPNDETARHTKGRGNGYVITLGGKRIYISGDTEDIPEMRQLKNIDMAFVCMNLPYTMTVDSAADAVLEFKPKEVFPYHYRGSGGLSDVAKFKALVTNGNDSIKVIQLNWYHN